MWPTKSDMMRPARLVNPVLGSLLLASAICRAGALQPVTDLVNRETLESRTEKPSTPVGHKLQKALSSRLYHRVITDELQIRDGLPSTPGCYMRMASGCPKHKMSTQVWRPDKWANSRNVSEMQCQMRKVAWDKFCEAEDAEMLFRSSQVNRTETWWHQVVADVARHAD
mmetsp:Transcript_78474/g.204649  ORF Transcript_78474/g.204649 Transcript_78474/m.204649 type:complete len:169 (+) Transcript_78474:105-611(+)